MLIVTLDVAPRVLDDAYRVLHTTVELNPNIPSDELHFTYAGILKAPIRFSQKMFFMLILDW